VGIELKNILVLYINLETHTEKQESTEKKLKSLGFFNIKRVPGVVHENSRVGCSLAHKKALELGLFYGTPFIVVEDDIVIKNTQTTVSIPETADALYLGISDWGMYNGKGHRQISVEKYNDEIYRLYNMLSGHAILYLNEDYVKMLIRSYDFFISTNDIQDKANAELMKYYEVYGMANPIFYQEGINEKYTNFTLPGKKAFNKFNAMMLK